MDLALFAELWISIRILVLHFLFPFLLLGWTEGNEITVFRGLDGGGNAGFCLFPCDKLVKSVCKRFRGCHRCDRFSVSNFNFADTRFGFEVIEEPVSSNFEMEVAHAC